MENNNIPEKQLEHDNIENSHNLNNNEEIKTNSQSADKEDIYKSRYSIASLVCGILSILSCLQIYAAGICIILAIAFGITGIKSSKKSMAIIGIILGIIAIILEVAISIWFYNVYLEHQSIFDLIAG